MTLQSDTCSTSLGGGLGWWGPLDWWGSRLLLAPLLWHKDKVLGPWLPFLWNQLLIRQVQILAQIWVEVKYRLRRLKVSAQNRTRGFVPFLFSSLSIQVLNSQQTWQRNTRYTYHISFLYFWSAFSDYLFLGHHCSVSTETREVVQSFL